LCHVGDDAQLDLRVVGGEEHRVGSDIASDESAPDLLAELGADGDVHQVRVTGGQAPGRCAGLVELCVYAARLRMDEERQRIKVRRLQLRQLAISVDVVDDIVQAAQPLERLLVGAVGAGLEAARLRQVKLLEQNLRELE